MTLSEIEATMKKHGIASTFEVNYIPIPPLQKSKEHCHQNRGIEGNADLYPEGGVIMPNYIKSPYELHWWKVIRILEHIIRVSRNRSITSLIFLRED